MNRINCIRDPHYDIHNYKYYITVHLEIMIKNSIVFCIYNFRNFFPQIKNIQILSHVINLQHA